MPDPERRTRVSPPQTRAPAEGHTTPDGRHSRAGTFIRTRPPSAPPTTAERLLLLVQHRSSVGVDAARRTLNRGNHRRKVTRAELRAACDELTAAGTLQVHKTPRLTLTLPRHWSDILAGLEQRVLEELHTSPALLLSTLSTALHRGLTHRRFTRLEVRTACEALNRDGKIDLIGPPEDHRRFYGLLCISGHRKDATLWLDSQILGAVDQDIRSPSAMARHLTLNAPVLHWQLHDMVNRGVIVPTGKTGSRKLRTYARPSTTRP